MNTEKRHNDDHRIKTEKDFTKHEIWVLISQNYEMIQGAQLSNSFIILMAYMNQKNH